MAKKLKGKTMRASQIKWPVMPLNLTSSRYRREKAKQSHPKLREAIGIVTRKSPMSKFPKAFKLVVWELMKTQTRLTKLEAKIMDKKMHKVTEKMKAAERDIKKDKPKDAVKVLKGAEKKNEKLVKIDKNVRDPIIERAKKHKC